MKRMLGLSVLVLTAALALGAAPAFAGELAVPAAAPAVAPAQPGCGETPDLAITLSAKPEICPAAQAQNPVPEFKFGRTCRCSCGYPCKTDADCGPGGLCTGGISCC